MIKLLILVYIYLIIQMSLVWLIYRLLKNPSIVDVSWSLGLMVAGLIYLGSSPASLHNYIISTLLIIWGLRLAGYIWYSRIRKGHIDKRYLELSKEWKVKKSLGFFLNYQLQAFFSFVISIVFLFSSRIAVPTISPLDVLGCLVVIIGIIGESTADLQLQHFKANHKGQVCNVGLWHYSRHPNYFFDWLTWCGFTLFSLRHPYGYIAIVSPVLLYIIFTRITGPLTEKGSIKSRGQAFIEYQKKTSMFFPRIRSKANSA